MLFELLLQYAEHCSGELVVRQMIVPCKCPVYA